MADNGSRNRLMERAARAAVGRGGLIAATSPLVVPAFSYRAANELSETANWVVHTHEVEREIARVLTTMGDLETGQRGYLITGDAQFLEPYSAALDRIDAEMAALGDWIADVATNSTEA